MFADKVRGAFWTWYLRSRGATVGRNLLVHGGLDILLRDGASLGNLTIGDNVKLGGRTYIRMRRQGRIVLGDHTRTGTEVWLVAANAAALTIGSNTVMGSYNILNGGHGIAIGRHCVIAAFVYLNSSNHRYDGPGLIQTQGHTGAPIEIGDDVWLGGQVVITQGVVIGTGAVIGAGAVVTRDIAEYQVAVGAPAHAIRDRRSPPQ